LGSTHHSMPPQLYNNKETTLRTRNLDIAKNRPLTTKLGKTTSYSIAVSVTFERTRDLNSDVIRLLLSGNCQHRTQSWKVQSGDLLIEILGKQIDVILVAFVFLPIRE